MKNVVWLKSDDPFPEEKYWQGWVVAYGGNISPSRLIDAYHKGIFPWYSEGEPIRWCSPDPRAVLPTHSLHIPQRLWREWKNKSFRITADTSFKEVVRACATTPRKHEDGTWITTEIQENYIQLHELGYAHSIECWKEKTLVGGLYGVHLGPLFVGESMFHHVSNASKIAFIALCGFSLMKGIKLIDCQVFSEHLERFGVFAVPRKKYLNWLKTNIPDNLPTEKWQLDTDKIYEKIHLLKKKN